jgi:hypothetical protein
MSMDDAEPHWAMIDEFYRVSSNGDVESRVRRISQGVGRGTRVVCGDSWRKIKPALDSYGYPQLRIHSKTRKVHHLVLNAFVAPRSPGQEYRHLNGVRTDNRVQNLAWGTGKENTADQVRHGTFARGARNGNAKLTRGDIFAIKWLRRRGESQEKIAKRFGVSQVNIGYIVRGEHWKHVTSGATNHV